MWMWPEMHADATASCELLLQAAVAVAVVDDMKI